MSDLADHLFKTAKAMNEVAVAQAKERRRWELYWRDRAQQYLSTLECIANSSAQDYEDPEQECYALRELAREAAYGPVECSICRRIHGREVEHACE